jgi:hypothetical protein
MSDEHADFINGLQVVEYQLEWVIGELDEMQDRNGIPALDRVSLNPLQWALDKLADDLHDASAEIREARLDVASAKREADEARQQQQAEQLQSLSIFNGLRAELETVKAELTKKLGELPPDPTPEPYQWQVGDEVFGDGNTYVVEEMLASGGIRLSRTMVFILQAGLETWGYQLHRKASDVPPTSQQVAEFAALTEPIDDSVGADGEGRS